MKCDSSVPSMESATGHLKFVIEDDGTIKSSPVVQWSHRAKITPRQYFRPASESMVERLSRRGNDETCWSHEGDMIPAPVSMPYVAVPVACTIFDLRLSDDFHSMMDIGVIMVSVTNTKPGLGWRRR